MSKATAEVINYLNKRKEEIRPLVSNKDPMINISYLPFIKGTKNIDSKGIFITRDLIGKIDSYRFYPEYFSYFNKLADELTGNDNWHKDVKYKKEIENILICLLHEPYLFDLLNSYLKLLLPFLANYLKLFLFAENEQNNFFYDWQKYALIQLAFLLVPDDILLIENFEKVLLWNDKSSNSYLHYKFWDFL
jgi:hypothetical protein